MESANPTIQATAYTSRPRRMSKAPPKPELGNVTGPIVRAPMRPYPAMTSNTVTTVRIKTVHLLKNVYFIVPTLHYMARLGRFYFGTKPACAAVRVELAIVGGGWQDPRWPTAAR